MTTFHLNFKGDSALRRFESSPGRLTQSSPTLSRQDSPKDNVNGACTQYTSIRIDIHHSGTNNATSNDKSVTIYLISKIYDDICQYT